ncbi:Abhydrolase_6 domain-containing protein [Cephalotus follicularis]|uniref:Abhydrolase_6 domain-containing protein n=1 Tax=Cephalotus follicularis TaxID=3775 RepID=A0A1Q3C9I4_CEPFO|nr:Abhydrolase_6 domain-containing protein [Cephalotus follicularis]
MLTAIHYMVSILSMSPVTSPGNLARKSAESLLTVLSFIVFFFLDFIELLLCLMYRYLDEYFEGKASACCCKGKEEGNGVGGGENELSETLYGRGNVFREMGFLKFERKLRFCRKEGDSVRGGLMVNSWSDCGCESCVQWMNGDKLHVVVRKPSGDHPEDPNERSMENVIFLHGFLSSSSFWTDSVFPNLSEPVKRNYRLFAVDLLGFGRSPKPRDSFYTLRDHIEMIEKSVICPYDLQSFHVVAHSMGCIVALALSAKYCKSVKSITLVAPPYFPSAKDGASLAVLTRLAKRRLWPPSMFGAAFMSWYEHLGRCVCLVYCRNHGMWEKILRILTRKRELHFFIVDLPRHTHRSAWYIMHNVICGGAKFADDFLEVLTKCGRKICVIQGDGDQVVPLECINNIKTKAPDVEVTIVANADHCTVIRGREKAFTQYIEQIWASIGDCFKDGTT